jgi:hypothetical protein
MATGRIISASFLTKRDKSVIELCATISKEIASCIDASQSKEFREVYGKTHNSRDGGSGRGAGKLQRDALCTRGNTQLTPISNRNLRWHPLVFANSLSDFGEPIKRIEIMNNQDLAFVVEKSGNEAKYSSAQVHEMCQRYIVLPEHWSSHVAVLKEWKDDWTRNRCGIPLSEACNWQDAVETYAVLGIAVAVELFAADFDNVYNKVYELLATQSIDTAIQLPSKIFPKSRSEITHCPVCWTSIARKPDELPERVRAEIWKPSWRNTKRKEGEDWRIQLTHPNPLVEQELRHNAGNVRYGHRWCNVAMTDHSLGETIQFMEHIVKAHANAKK